MREIIELDENWKFHQGYMGSGFSKSRFFNYISKELPEAVKTNTNWETVKVPHDWDARGPFLKTNKSGSSGGYAPCGIGWYFREFNFSEEDKNKIILLNFDGIYKRASIWLNTKYVGYHYYGYGPFEVDITNYVKFNERNVLHIRLNNDIQPSCRWYSGSGIYREVHLIKKEPIHIPWGGVFAQLESVTEREAILNISTEICSTQPQSQPILVHVRIKNAEDMIISETSSECIVSAGNSPSNPLVIAQKLSVRDPIRWDIDHPYLYRIEVTIQSGSHIADCETFKYGIREFQFNGSGFFLNGKNMKLKGACVHHDGGCVGAAVPKAIWRRRLATWKSMGGNAIRTSHNVPASNFLEVCDELGLVVIAEAFDKWHYKPKKGAWGGRAYFKYWKQELTNFIRRDRNHPCIVLWSLGNEIAGLQTARVKKLHMKMYDYVKNLDPTRPITTVLSPNGAAQVLKGVQQGKNLFFHDMVDVFCTNYTEKYLPEIHSLIPDKSVIIAEAHHYYRNLGKREINLPRSDLHPSCTTRNPWYDVAEHDYCAGQFLWVGIEYLGEVRDPYPYHGRTNAPIRINGLKKPQAGFHESVWSEVPFIQLSILDPSANIPRGKPQFDFPKIVRHWNFEDHSQKKFEAWIFTNCESVELVRNGTSLGEKTAKDYPYNTMTFQVEYQPGEITAIGKNNGREVSRSTLKTAGEPRTIQLLCDKLKITADGKDCIHIFAQIHDDSGNLVQFKDRQIIFSISGEATLLGIDSGDLSNFTERDAYRQTICRTYWGEAVVIIQATKTHGKITVSVEGQGLSPAKIELESLSA